MNHLTTSNLFPSYLDWKKINMASRTDYNNPKSSESLGLPYHYEMVSDHTRVAPFKEAILQTCQGKRVLESGAGSAILSILAARAGATKVYAVEMDDAIAVIARKNILESGYSDVITLIIKDLKDITLDDLDGKKVDVAIAENLSTWQVTEPQIQLMNHINRLLIHPKGDRIPNTIFNEIELAHSQYIFEGIEIRTYYFEFTGVHSSQIKSAKYLFREIDLNQISETKIEQKIILKVNSDGIVNSIRLTSPLQVGNGIFFSSSDSLMPPVVFPLDEDLQVKAKDLIEVHIKYKNNTSWEKFSCSAKIVRS